MAICVNESWTTIIANVDRINRFYLGDILQFFMKEYDLVVVSPHNPINMMI